MYGLAKPVIPEGHGRQRAVRTESPLGKMWTQIGLRPQCKFVGTRKDEEKPGPGACLTYTSIPAMTSLSFGFLHCAVHI